MRKLTAQPRAGVFATLLSVSLVALFGYANLLCVAGGAAFDACEHHEADSECAHADATHHGEVPAQPAKDCSKDSCFCITMNTVVTQQTMTTPNSALSVLVADFVGLHSFDVVPVLTAAYEHGRPAIAPPDYLFSKTLSPRAPPRGA